MYGLTRGLFSQPCFFFPFWEKPNQMHGHFKISEITAWINCDRQFNFYLNKMFSLFLSLIKFHNILVEGSHQNQQIISFVKYLARVSRLKFFLMFFIKHHRKIVHTPLADYLKDLILMSFKEGNPIYLIYFPMTLVYFQKRVRSPPQDISTQG